MQITMFLGIGEPRCSGRPDRTTFGQSSYRSQSPFPLYDIHTPPRPRSPQSPRGNSSKNFLTVCHYGVVVNYITKTTQPADQLFTADRHKENSDESASSRSICGSALVLCRGFRTIQRREIV